MPTLYCRDCGNCPALFVPGATGKYCPVCGGQLLQALPGIFVDYVPSRSAAKVAVDGGAKPEPAASPSEPIADSFEFAVDAPARRRRGAGPVTWGLVMSMTFLAVGAAIVLAWPKERSVASHTRKTTVEDRRSKIEDRSPNVPEAAVAQATINSALERPAVRVSRGSPEAAQDASEAPRAEPAAVDGPRPRPVGIAAGLREAAVAKPFDRPEPPEQKVAVACKDGTCGSPKESSAPSGQYGTSLTFTENRYSAEKEAKESGKLLFLLNISGNFDESKFT
jgi:hypothetical protein